MPPNADAPKPKNPATLTVAVAVVFAVVALVYTTGEWGAASSRPSNAGRPGESSAALAIAVQHRPLPEGTRTIQQAWELAVRDALAWKSDARIVRLYAGGISRDGAFERSGGVQVVFVSAAATAEGPPTMNGLRWACEGGAFWSGEILQYPAPNLAFPTPRLCDIAAVAGEEAPLRMTLDVQYASPASAPPSFQLFADKPQKWLAIADPATCAVQLRSTPATAQEAADVLAPDAGREGGDELFDVAVAENVVDAVLGRASTCGAGASGSVAVTFASGGKVDKVEFHPPSLRTSPAASCIADRLRRIQVAPWRRGSGRVERKFRI